MPIGISGKRIIVTGGARGIGAATVEHFVEEGALVAAFDVRPEGREVAARASAAGPGHASFRQVDVSKRAEVAAAVDAAVAELGGLDAVFNIAAVERSSWAADITEEGWAETLGVNVMGVANMCQAVFPHLKAAGGGSVVNFASDVAFQPYSRGAHYSASKGAVVSYTRTLAAEWGRDGIRANCVMPLVWTPMFDEKRARMSPAELEAFDARMAAIIPLTGKFGDGRRDLAPVLAFLASDASRYVSAQNIGVNGGSAWSR